MLINTERSPFYIFRHYATFFQRKKFQKFQVFFERIVLRFLSLRYGADFRRSRLVRLVLGVQKLHLDWQAGPESSTGEIHCAIQWTVDLDPGYDLVWHHAQREGGDCNQIPESGRGWCEKIIDQLNCIMF